MTEFSYRQVENGIDELLPDLAKHLGILFPNHQQIFHQILTGFDLHNWKVIFSPSRNFFSHAGLLLRPFKVIIIANHLDRKEVIVTFYHEIIHQLYPFMGEDETDEMAYQWYEEDYYKVKVKKNQIIPVQETIGIQGIYSEKEREDDKKSHIIISDI